MDNLVEKNLKKVLNEENITFDDALFLASNGRLSDLLLAANTIRNHFHNREFDLCSIINGRSGRCSEDCKFCAQSSSYRTDIKKYDTIDETEALVQAQDNESHGIKRFSIVTAGRSLSMKQLEGFGHIFQKIGQKTGLKLCASMGMLTAEKAEALVANGVSRYHCNLETSKSYFGQICTTHTWQEKVETIKIARKAGMDICSGGIIGIGESLEQRLELAFELAELGIQSIPINILVPIPKTPFATKIIPKWEEVLTCIALFRFINPRAVIRLAGGRNQYGKDQYQCFSSGANGAIVGNYLTTLGNDLNEDLSRIKEMGFYI